MSRLLDWIRFRGWRNAYWRADANHARCPHSTPPWLIDDDEPFYFVCSDCGASVSGFVVIRSDSQNTTTRFVTRGGFHA